MLGRWIEMSVDHLADNSHYRCIDIHRSLRLFDKRLNRFEVDLMDRSVDRFPVDYRNIVVDRPVRMKIVHVVDVKKKTE